MDLALICYEIKQNKARPLVEEEVPVDILETYVWH